MKFNNPLTKEEQWIHSDREILGRAEKTAGKVGIVLTTKLPNGDDFQMEVDRLNADTGGTYCNMVREYFDEWKTSKAAASRRKQHDREQQAILDAEGSSVSGGDLQSGILSVPETVQALEEGVQGATSLEEEVIHRIDAAYDARAKLNEELAAITTKLTQCEVDIKQLEQMREIFNASKILEATVGSVRSEEESSEGELGTEARSPTPDQGGGQGTERGGSED
jgi:chromosome segregation ATPase